jgi:hypothetical protein
MDAVAGCTAMGCVEETASTDAWLWSATPNQVISIRVRFFGRRSVHALLASLGDSAMKKSGGNMPVDTPATIPTELVCELADEGQLERWNVGWRN